MNQSDASYMEICRTLRDWFREHDYRGIDPFQLDERVFKYRKVPFLSSIRSLLKPFHSWIPRRTFSAFPPIIIPKALGLIISGNSHLYRMHADSHMIEENYHLLGLLKETTNRDYEHPCWGWPFEWGHNPRYEKNTPLVCVTSPIAHALLDFFEIVEDWTLIDYLDDISSFFTEENGYDAFDDALCLHYSPLDRNLVYNGNAMAASFILRLDRVRGDSEKAAFARRAINFVLDGQKSDGAWHYSDEKGERHMITIDNRHTGFVLEALSVANRTLNDNRLQRAIEKGWSFYKEHLFEGAIPKWSTSQTYPVDIHDVAQSILTASELGYGDFAEKILQFGLTHLFNGEDGFYYKYFRNGRKNETIFFRWGQAWMFKAMSTYMLQNRLEPTTEVQLGVGGNA